MEVFDIAAKRFSIFCVRQDAKPARAPPWCRAGIAGWKNVAPLWLESVQHNYTHFHSNQGDRQQSHIMKN